jgi:hypothetical protein
VTSCAEVQSQDSVTSGDLHATPTRATALGGHHRLTSSPSRLPPPGFESMTGRAREIVLIACRPRHHLSRRDAVAFPQTDRPSSRTSGGRHRRSRSTPRLLAADDLDVAVVTGSQRPHSASDLTPQEGPRRAVSDRIRRSRRAGAQGRTGTLAHPRGPLVTFVRGGDRARPDLPFSRSRSNGPRAPHRRVAWAHP